jgi:hypothetical protein
MPAAPPGRRIRRVAGVQATGVTVRLLGELEAVGENGEVLDVRGSKQRASTRFACGFGPFG